MPWRRHSPFEYCYQSLDTAKSLQSTSQPRTTLPGSLPPLSPESLGYKAGIKAVPQLPFGACRQSALMTPKTPLSIRNPTCFAPQKPPRWSPMAYFMDCHVISFTPLISEVTDHYSNPFRAGTRFQVFWLLMQFAFIIFYLPAAAPQRPSGVCIGVYWALMSAEHCSGCQGYNDEGSSHSDSS